jgi:prepilin-type N-terminal cleavage/methylation domain-containing protein
MPRREGAARARATGFTLIEVLVVLAIIGLLSAVLLRNIFSVQKDRYKFEAQGFISTITAALEVYKNDRRIGVYPPTSYEKFGGVGRLDNRTNLGIESLVACLNGPGYEGDRVLETFSDEKHLANTDADQTPKTITIYKDAQLFEIKDPWGNPYAYFNCTEYDDPQVRLYMVDVAEGGGEYEPVTVVPHTNPQTKSYYNLTSYQLFSAGPDRQFNTDDDVGNW